MNNQSTLFLYFILILSVLFSCEKDNTVTELDFPIGNSVVEQRSGCAEGQEMKCFCVCVSEPTENLEGISMRTEVPCRDNITCTPPVPGREFSCQVERRCVRVSNPPPPSQGPDCFCLCEDANGEPIRYDIRCQQDCNRQGTFNCEKFFK